MSISPTPSKPVSRVRATVRRATANKANNESAAAKLVPTPRVDAEISTSASGVMQSPTTGEWREMVATAAYFRAEHRGFRSGSAEQDWIEAEAELKQRFNLS